LERIKLMTLSRILVFCLILISYVGAAAVQQTAKQPEKWEQFQAYAYVFYRNIHIEPTDRTVEKVKNKHVDGQVDERHTLEYPGFRVVFYRVLEAGSAPRDIVESLVITDCSIPLPYGVSFGDSQEKVVQLLGPPFREDINWLTYREKIMEMDTLQFNFSSGRLVKVAWNNWID
jgi:hypothetical protein